MALTKDIIDASELAQRVVDLFEKYHVTEDLSGRAPSGVIESALKKGGMTTLGAGHFGAVLPLGNSNVLKVCIEDADGYKLFAEWAKRNPGPGVPAIFYTYEHPSGVFFAAMPKYINLNTSDKERIERLRDTPGNYIGDVISRVLAEFGELAERDTHTGNFMYCQKTGMYVVTDPLARIYTRVDEAVAKAKGKEYVRPMDEQLGLDFNATAKPIPVLNIAKPQQDREFVADWAKEFEGRRETSWPDNWGRGFYEFDWAANPGVKWIAWDDTAGTGIAVWTARDPGRPSPGVWRCCRKRPEEPHKPAQIKGQAIADRFAAANLNIDPRIQFFDHQLDGLRAGPFNIDPAINARR